MAKLSEKIQSTYKPSQVLQPLEKAKELGTQIFKSGEGQTRVPLSSKITASASQPVKQTSGFLGVQTTPKKQISTNFGQADREKTYEEPKQSRIIADQMEKEFGYNPEDPLRTAFTRKMPKTAEEKKRYSELLNQHQQAKLGEKPLLTGVISGINPLGEGYFDVAEKMSGIEQTGVEKAKESNAYNVGRTLGTVGKYASAYSTLGGAISGGAGAELGGVGGSGSLAPTLSQRLASGAVGGLTGELAKDVAIGGTLGAIESVATGKNTKEEFAKGVMLDSIANLVFYGAGNALKSLRQAKNSKVVQQVADQLNVTTKEADDIVESVIKKTPQSEVDFYVNRSGVASKQPVDQLQLQSPTQQTFEQWRKENFGGAFGKVSDEDMTALRQLYTEDVQLPKPRQVERPFTLTQAEKQQFPSLQPLKQEPLQKTVASQVEQPSLSTTATTPSQLDQVKGETITATRQPFDVQQGAVKERGFSENIKTDVNRPDSERAIFDKDPLFYEQLANSSTLGSAQKRFSKGYEDALKDFDLTKNDLRADNVPLAKLIADEAVKRGDMQTARRVLTDVAETLTTAGQYSQAAKILRESNDPVTILNFVQKEIKKLNTQGKNRYSKWNNIELNENELSLIGKLDQNVTDEQKEVLFQQIFDSISTRIPTSNREKFDALRRMAMLFNPKTHVRNTVGNAIMAGTKKVADTIATGLEKKILPKNLRTKSITASKELKNTAQEYWDANKTQLMEGGRWEIFGVKSPFAEKRIFNNNFLESLNKISRDTLEKEDIFFLKRHFQSDLANFMQARGIKEPTKNAVDYALRRAQEATFREANELSTAINRLKGTKAGLIVEAAIPFTKTPANIMATGAKFSPIGLIESVHQLATKASPEKTIETLSKGLTGTGLTLVGYYMAKNGYARGEYEKSNKVEGLKQASGDLPNSIIFPNGSYTIDWAQPTAIPFFMGVGLAESLKKSKGEDSLQAGIDALIAGGDTLVNSTMLKNVKELFGGSYGSTTEKILQLPVNYATQAFPTVLGQVARTADPTKRQLDYNEFASTTKQQLQAKTPLASKLLPPKRDILGVEIKYGEGFSNAIQQFFSPGYIGKKSNDPILKELNRLYESEGSSFLPRAKVSNFTYDKEDYRLNNEEISKFQEIMGDYTQSKLKTLINSNEYKSKSDSEKAKAIKKINDDGYDKAKEDIVKERK